MNHPITNLGDSNFEFAKSNGEDMYWFPREELLMIFTKDSTEIIEAVPRGTNNTVSTATNI